MLQLAAELISSSRVRVKAKLAGRPLRRAHVRRGRLLLLLPIPGAGLGCEAEAPEAARSLR